MRSQLAHPFPVAYLMGVVLALEGFSADHAVENSPTSSNADERPALLFLHGFTCDPTFWKYQTTYFEKDYRVYAPILPFHPGSKLLSEPTVEGLAEAMFEYIQETIGVPPVVIGHSLGGMVALQLALQFPESLRAVVLADAYPSLEVSKRASLGLFSPSSDEGLREDIEKKMEAVRDRMNPEDRERLWKSIDTMDVASRLGGIALPVFGIYGGRDRFKEDEEDRLKKEIALDRIDESTVTVLGGVGHFVQMERPEEFNMILEAFIERLVGTTGPTEGGLLQNNRQQPDGDTHE